MSTLNATYSQNTLNGSYGQNLAYAARLLLAALLAVKPSTKSATVVAAKDRKAARDVEYFASSYDALSPNREQPSPTIRVTGRV